MEVMTYSTILTTMCDFFDTLISPKTLLRSNSNIIYLIFKGIAKGLEVINNVCVSLSSKFNPASCSDDDLLSVADMVGTERLAGAQSGLRVVAYNNSTSSITLLAGTYTYAYSADESFTCEITADVTIASGEYIDLVFISDDVGEYAVTTQQSISITSDADIPSEITFSCSDNDSLLGYDEETVLEFRKRILSDTERQDTINELKVKLNNLPYVYDCEIIFNRDTSSMVYGAYTIPPYYMLICMSTAYYKKEIAKIVAENAIYPTVEVSGESHEIDYENSVFASGSYPVYINDFTDKEFTATITYKADADYISSSTDQTEMRKGLMTAVNTNRHKDAITAEDIFSYLNALNIAGLTIYGVQLFVSGNQVAYVSCLKTEIAKLADINFSEVS